MKNNNQSQQPGETSAEEKNQETEKLTNAEMWERLKRDGRVGNLIYGNRQPDCPKGIEIG